MSVCVCRYSMCVNSSTVVLPVLLNETEKSHTHCKIAYAFFGFFKNGDGNWLWILAGVKLVHKMCTTTVPTWKTNKNRLFCRIQFWWIALDWGSMCIRLWDWGQGWTWTFFAGQTSVASVVSVQCFCPQSLIGGPRREARVFWCLSPVGNLRGVIWFHFTVSCLVFWLTLIAVSVSSFFYKFLNI